MANVLMVRRLLLGCMLAGVAVAAIALTDIGRGDAAMGTMRGEYLPALRLGAILADALGDIGRAEWRLAMAADPATLQAAAGERTAALGRAQTARELLGPLLGTPAAGDALAAFDSAFRQLGPADADAALASARAQLARLVDLEGRGGEAAVVAGGAFYGQALLVLGAGAVLLGVAGAVRLAWPRGPRRHTAALGQGAISRA